MSTKKTEHYGLHVWEPGDDFLREEFNENFELLDQGIWKNKFVSGSYSGLWVGNSGTGTEAQDIELGFRPRVVLLMANLSATNNNQISMIALAIDGVKTDGFLFSDTGFRVSRLLNQMEGSYTSIKPTPYRYLAWQ